MAVLKPDLPSARLTRVYNGVTTVVRLPIVSSIEMSMSVSLTELDTIIYGYQNKYIIDLGTVQRYSVTVERVNPPDFNNASSDPERWSNGKWYEWFEDLLNVWQVELNDYQGGFVFEYTPAGRPSGAPSGAEGELLSTTELYPSIRKNVFIIGSISPSRTLQRMRLTLPLVVGRISGEGVQPEMQPVRFVSGISGMADVTVEFAVGQRAPFPSASDLGWSEVGQKLYGWTTVSGGTEAEYHIGDNKTWTKDDETFYAIWRTPLVQVLFCDKYDGIPEGLIYEGDTLVLNRTTLGPETYAKLEKGGTIEIHAVGGGGGCGGYIYAYSHTRGQGTMSVEGYGDMCKIPGGGGASGEYRSRMTSVSCDQTIKVELGAGGGPPPRTTKTYGYVDDWGPMTGNSGSSTKVYLDSEPLVEAAGGAGGDAPRNLDWNAWGAFVSDEDREKLWNECYAIGGQGDGVYSYSGGNTARGVARSGVFAEDGYSPEGRDTGGKGGVNVSVARSDGWHDYWPGGAGGGANGFNLIMVYSTKEYPCTCRGGDGGYRNGEEYKDSTSGQFGGGAGSMVRPNGGGDYIMASGARGAVAIFIYEGQR